MEPAPPQHSSLIPSLPHRAKPQPHPYSAHPQPHRSIPAPWSLPPNPQCLSSISQTHPCSTEPISSSFIHPKTCLGTSTSAGQFWGEPAWVTCLKSPCSHLHPGHPSLADAQADYFQISEAGQASIAGPALQVTHMLGGARGVAAGEGMVPPGKRPETHAPALSQY